MIKLSEEIITHVISHLAEQRTDCGDDQSSGESHSYSLLQNAAMSRSWQGRTKTRNFAHITLTPARVAAPLAAQALSPSRVHRFFRSVQLDVLLPSHSEDARTRHEDVGEKRANDMAFTDVIQNVVALLSSHFPADSCGQAT